MNDLTTIDRYCQLAKTGLVFKGDVSPEEWMHVFRSLKAVEGCVQFWIGDCLVYRERRWGMYDDIAEETGYEERTLRLAKHTAEKIESGRRLPDLSFSHHAEVAALSPDQQEHYLQKALDEKLSVRDMRRAIHEDKYQAIRELECIIPSSKYRIVYADPPWAYGNDRTYYGGDQASHYPTMTIDELCNMPVRDLVEHDAVLFLWVTSPILEECFKVIASWGFQYKSSFVWDKVKHNMGHYNSVRHEFLLICTRGSCLPDVNKLHDSVVSLERSDKHSEKPSYFRELIDQLYPNGSRIELFARGNKIKGWDQYGNEANIS